MVVKEETEEDSSRNLLQRFGVAHGGNSTAEAAGGGDTRDVELSLGLSLNGCFGVEPKEKRFIRSSSISSFSIFPTEHNVPLTRTCSLPEETEEGRRKRKEIESFKRMEAKRKRSEKRAVKGEVGRWVMGKRANGGGRPASQGSSSSSVSDFESKPMQGVDMSGLGNCAEVKSPLSTIPPASNHAIQKALTREGDEPLKKKKSCRTNGVIESERSMVEEMPRVSTKGDGPNGRRIQGFLYKYRKGGEVRIVCVCHGQFLTPAEFVKHAGGGDVVHPLRHIVVDPTPLL